MKKAIQPARRKRKTGNCPLDHGAVQTSAAAWAALQINDLCWLNAYTRPLTAPESGFREFLPWEGVSRLK